MSPRLSPQQMSGALTKAIRNNLFSDENSAVIFHDLSFLEQRIDHIKQLFPETHSM